MQPRRFSWPAASQSLVPAFLLLLAPAAISAQDELPSPEQVRNAFAARAPERPPSRQPPLGIFPLTPRAAFFFRGSIARRLQAMFPKMAIVAENYGVSTAIIRTAMLRTGMLRTTTIRTAMLRMATILTILTRRIATILTIRTRRIRTYRVSRARQRTRTSPTGMARPAGAARSTTRWATTLPAPMRSSSAPMCTPATSPRRATSQTAAAGPSSTRSPATTTWRAPAPSMLPT